MRLRAIALACLLGACASTYAAHPNDPVDMAAELGNRGRQYMAMGEVCDAAANGAYRQAVAEALHAQQQRLGVLAGLVQRAYRARATHEHMALLQTEMRAQGHSAAEYCSAMVRRAQVEAQQRTAHILTLSPYVDTMGLARHAQEPAF